MREWGWWWGEPLLLAPRERETTMQLFHEDGTPKTPAEMALVHEPEPAKKPKTGKVTKTTKPNGQGAAPEKAATAKETPKTKPQKKERPVRPTCAQAKKNGQPCTAHVMLDSEGKPTNFCTDHRPAHQHLTEAEMARVVALLEGTKGSRDAAEVVVALMGWGQVREAIRKGRL